MIYPEVFKKLARMIKQITVAFLLIVVKGGLLFSQTNYSMYSLDDVYPICLSEKDNLIYGVKWQDNAMIINSYDLNTGDVKKSFSENLPENPIKLMLAHPQKDILYLITAKKIDDTGIRYVDQVYELNAKNGKVKSIGCVYYNYLIPNKIGMVGNLLVFTTLQNPTYVFDLKNKSFRLLNPNIHYQLLSIAPEKKGFLMLNVNETYQGHIPVYFMNMKNEFSDVIGYLSRKITIQSEMRNFQLPAISLVDSSYTWIGDAIRYNCFPIYNFEIAMRPFWLKQSILLDKAYELAGISAANQSYLIARSGKSSYVYNYAVPNSTAPTSLTQIDIENIESFYNESVSYEQSVISSDKVDAIFDAVFYKVFKKNKFKYIAAQFHGTYFELNEYSMLVPMLQSDFKLKDEIEAKKFQNALGVLFPINSFNEKVLAFEIVEGGWRFVRGEAFEKEYGIFVRTDELGKILEIEYKSEL